MPGRQVLNVAKAGVLQKLAVTESAIAANKIALQGYYSSNSNQYSGNSPSGYSSGYGSNQSGFGNYGPSNNSNKNYSGNYSSGYGQNYNSGQS